MFADMLAAYRDTHSRDNATTTVAKAKFARGRLPTASDDKDKGNDRENYLVGSLPEGAAMYAE